MLHAHYSFSFLSCSAEGGSPITGGYTPSGTWEATQCAAMVDMYEKLLRFSYGSTSRLTEMLVKKRKAFKSPLAGMG